MQKQDKSNEALSKAQMMVCMHVRMCMLVGALVNDNALEQC
jgi:hypothetical protein